MGSSAKSTLQKFKEDASALSCSSRLNVHGYDGLEPWKEARHRGVRASLHEMAEQSNMTVWQSEFGSNDEDGMKMAQAIMEDFMHLRPKAWCYWQLVEHHCSWGLVEANFSPEEGAKATKLPHPKYYVFAQFTRFLRSGMELLTTTDPRVAAGYCAESATLVIFMLNLGDIPCQMALDVPCLSTPSRRAKIVTTVPRAPMKFLAERTVDEVVTDLGEGRASGIRVQLEAEPYSVSSVVVDGVVDVELLAI